MSKEPKNMKKILAAIDGHYPIETKCYLDYETDWQLLIATILSAQCTDDRVNIVTKTLFKKYPDIESFASSDIFELENDIKSTGFYRNKAKNIKNCAIELLIKHDGRVPSDIDELIKLPGVGRKTANVIRGHIFDIPCIVVDTHVKRLSNRFGFVKSDDPEKIEFALYKIIPRENWIKYNTQLIAHGRAICKSQRPKCDICFMSDICFFYKKNKK